MADSPGALARIRTGFSVAVGLLILSVIVSILWEPATYAGAVFGLVALVFGLPLIRPGQRRIGVILLGAGVVAMAAALLLGFRPEPLKLLNLNQDLVGMLGAVAFLGFIPRTVGEVTPRLTGAAAVWRTLIVTHLLGSVINLSSVTVVADHVKKSPILDPGNAMIVTRGFSSAGFWSPFWAGAALALVFAPEANIGLVMAVGAPLALASLALAMPNVLRAFGDELPSYRGYALSWRLLRIPLVLMASVLVLHTLIPSIPIPRFIALFSVLAIVLYCVLAGRRRAPRLLLEEMRTVLPGLGGEVTLFISAGVMALGLSALISTLHVELPIDTYSVWVAWASTIVIVLLSLVGVHQVITIGLVGTLVVPLGPDPSLFMLSAIVGHGISAATGPLNGLQMYMQGRYHVDGIETTKRNMPFCIAAVVLVLPVLFLVQWLSGMLGG